MSEERSVLRYVSDERRAATKSWTKGTSRISGDYSEEVTPVPISNTVVKLFSAEDTWRGASRETRTSPVFSFLKKEQSVLQGRKYLLYLVDVFSSEMLCLSS